ncbi:putative quinol monooxygenase [Streptomyces sp. NPDC001843]|uniref:putative quinol monooxygenase n=1 Tax=Streptomyces sp. NPDC001843 TaxID=3364617 RepID=UPI0036B37ECB
MLIAIVDFDTAATDRAAALGHLDAERDRISAMPGNLAFRVYASREDDSRITIVHEWEDEASFAGYLGSASFARFGEAIRPLMVGAPVSRRFRGELLATVA